MVLVPGQVKVRRFGRFVVLEHPAREVTYLTAAEAKLAIEQIQKAVAELEADREHG